MSKINLLIILFIATFLNACGFHIPTNSSAINALIVSEKSNIFAQELTKSFNPSARKNLSLKIGAEVRSQKVASFTSGSTVNSYTLNLSVPIQVSNLEQKILLSKTLEARKHVNKIFDSSQADRLQIEEIYVQLRRTLVKKFIRQLSKLK
jgi:outer membrane lipopolysaccharide assembly protein LptE/RlpB